MAVFIPLSLLTPIAKEMGGTFLVRGEEAVVRFGEPKGWTFDCLIPLGPERTVRAAGGVTWRMSYHGEKNRLDPSVQDRKRQIHTAYNSRLLACQAMTCPTTALHGKTLDEIRGMVRDTDGFDDEMLELDVITITPRWSVLADGDYIGHKIMKSPPYLVREDHIYIPLADTR